MRSIYINQDSRGNCMKQSGASNGIYGLGFIGALIFYIQQATSFGGGVVGFLKALVWPAFLVYDLLKYINM